MDPPSEFDLIEVNVRQLKLQDLTWMNWNRDISLTSSLPLKWQSENIISTDLENKHSILEKKLDVIIKDDFTILYTLGVLV